MRSFQLVTALLAGLTAVATAASITTLGGSTDLGDHDGGHHHPDSECRCFPGDACWPKVDEWNALNKTVGGRLIKTIPLARPCHDPYYDAAECKKLQDGWLFSQVHMDSSSSVMAPLFANASCDPFQPRTGSCTLGNYVRYAVNVTKPEDISATLSFATKHNIRFVIRNTGHDYNGRSTAAGGLAVWTHHLKSTKVVDWRDKHYTGKALKVGAGVQGFEALSAARKAGLAVVTGECPTVGLAGGYIQGGGHSALSTVFGLAADNALEFEVVTVKGDLVTANATHNSDLFWALSGGGGGNYGVVYSATVRAHPDARVAGAKFALEAPADDPSKVYDIISRFHTALPGIVDRGVMVIYYFGAGYLQSPAVTAYNKTSAELAEILNPLKKSLAEIGVTLKPNLTQYDSYYDHFNHYWGPLPSGNIQVGVSLFGGRLIPRAALPKFGPTAKKLVELGVTFIGVGLNVSSFGGGSKDTHAVLPQWRTSIVESSLTLGYNFSLPYSEMVARQNNITDRIQPVAEAATPGAGAYMNEADFAQKDFQGTFYGENYDRLRRVKRRWDPEEVLWVLTGVGSEGREVRHDGRLCRKRAGEKSEPPPWGPY